MQAEHDCSKTTVSAYRTDFNHFMHFLNINGYDDSIHEIKTAEIRDYVDYLKFDLEFKTNTIRRKIHSLSSFYKYLMENEYIVKNPMLPIHAPKKEISIPIYLEPHEIKMLLEAPDKYARVATHINRDKAILAFFFYTGARRSELIAMNWSDVDFGRKSITVRKGKGKKPRMIPMHDNLSEPLWNYLQDRLPLADNALFFSENGTRISITAVHTVVMKYIEKCGLGGKGYTIHKLRHSFATTLYQKGTDILAIKELLGHEDLNTTDIYTHTSKEHLKKSIDTLKF